MLGAQLWWWPAIAAVALAGVNWWSAGVGRRDIEQWTKPGVLVCLILVAATIPTQMPWVRWWIVVGLVCGLIGDVLLFRDRFISGLVAFFIGHMAYVLALIPLPRWWPAVITGVIVVAIFTALWGFRIAGQAYRQSHVLGYAVAAYMSLLGVVVILGVGTWSLLSIAVVLFFISDTLIGWGRFVGAAPGGHVAVMVTYHGAQAGLVVALVS